MLHIAICDDEKIFREKIEKYVITYMKTLHIEYTVDTYSSGIEFLNQGMEMLKYHILFLDINMEELDGIQTAKRIREVSKELFIVFVTAYIRYSLEGYKVGAIRYLLKSNKNFENAINECFDCIIQEMDYNVIKMDFTFIEGTKNVLLENIIFIESNLHRLDFYIMEQKLNIYSLYAKLSEIEKQLSGNRFIRIHQSFLVNLRHLKNVSNYKAMLNNDMVFNIPKSRYKTVKESFIAYKGEI